MALLFDFYGSMLTVKQQEFFDMFYNEDLSLGEISENEGITRQGVRDVIHRAELILKDMEEKLGIVARYGRVDSDMLAIADAGTPVIRINDRNYGKRGRKACKGYLKDASFRKAEK
jgi:predicted DNA-binding protein YlxM (UPF0122 family)